MTKNAQVDLDSAQNSFHWRIYMLLSSQLWLKSLALDLRIFGDLQQGQKVQSIGVTLLELPRVQEGA